MTEKRLTGPFVVNEIAQLVNTKNRKYIIQLKYGAKFHTNQGIILLDEIIGLSEGSIITSSKGENFSVFRPLLTDYIMSMPRSAQIIYPKDSAQIIYEGDITFGAKVLEAGTGSGSLSCAMLRAIGFKGYITSYEVRKDHAYNSECNIKKFFSEIPKNWNLILGNVNEYKGPRVDRAVLDVLAPWEVLQFVADSLMIGGVLMIYVTTVTQLSRTIEFLREQNCWNEPSAWETIQRGWHVINLAVRPMSIIHNHTAFLIKVRKLASKSEFFFLKKNPKSI